MVIKASAAHSMLFAVMRVASMFSSPFGGLVCVVDCAFVWCDRCMCKGSVMFSFHPY